MTEHFKWQIGAEHPIYALFATAAEYIVELHPHTFLWSQAFQDHKKHPIQKGCLI
jgi:hypothetical protein